MGRWNRWSVVLVIAACAAAAPRTRAQVGGSPWVDDGGAPADVPVQLGITTAGGVSLGAYQAGFLYYLIETVHANPELVDVKVLSGASAGIINAMLAVIALGRPPVADPTDSLFFRVWSQLSFSELLDVRNAPPLAVSSRAALEKLAAQVEREWNLGLREDLDVVVGATATRVTARQVEVHDDFTVPRQEEKFVFRVRGKGRGLPPLVSNYVDAAHGIPQPLLPFSESPSAVERRRDFSILKDLMYASSAFPMAFPAQKLRFCMTYPDLYRQFGAQVFRMCRTPTHEALFVDGSMFDRSPLGLAARTMVSGLTWRDGAWRWRETPNTLQGSLPPGALLLYVDALNAAYPPSKPEAPSRRIEALFPAFGSYSQGFVRASQAKEIYTLIDQWPQVRSHIDMTTRAFPTASGLMANFFGFFDRDFRVFDFYLGMFDAHRYVESRFRRFLRRSETHATLHLPEMREGARRVSGWEPYRCMRWVFDGDDRYAAACAQVDEDVVILIQVALDRLYDNCRSLDTGAVLTHSHCFDAASGKAPPRVIPVPEDAEDGYWHRGADETELQHTVRLLELYRFHFEDLGLDRDASWLALSRIRETLAGALDDYAAKLPPAERLTVRMLGKPALNFFAYQPPQVVLYLVAGKGAEFALSAAGKYTPVRWIRFNLALQLKGLFELLGPEANLFALTPLAGIELENVRWSNPVVQMRLGLRVGYQWSTEDAFSDAPCSVDRFRSENRACSSPVGQAFLALTLFERLRVQGGVEWFPYFLPPLRSERLNLWNGFIEVGWQWISPF